MHGTITAFVGRICASMSSISAPLAFVFPGQGSQSIGMLAELAAAHAEVAATFEEASQGAGHDLWSLSAQWPEDQLNRTENTQPALLADRKSVVSGKSVSVRVDTGGSRIIKKKKNNKTQTNKH